MKYISELAVLDYSAPFIKLPERGELTIHSLFNNTCNLQWENRLLTLGSEETLLMPSGLRLKIGSSYLDFGLKVGEKASFKATQFQLPSGHRFSLNSSKGVDLSYHPTPLKKRLNLEMGLEILTPLLFFATYAEYGVAPVLALLFPSKYPQRKQNVYTDFLYPAFLKLGEIVKAGDGEKLKAIGPKVAGCGPGLTPSSDDFISGLCVGLYLLGGLNVIDNQQAKGMAVALTTGAAPWTNFISGQHMLHVGEGFFTKPFHRLCKSFILMDKGGIEESTVEITNYGSTSGCDMLTGFVTALELFV